MHQKISLEACVLTGQQLDLILPEEIYELVRVQLEQEGSAARGVYAKVFMRLEELLDGEFFTEYIKNGGS